MSHPIPGMDYPECQHCHALLDEDEYQKHYCTRCEERGCQEPQDAPEPDPDFIIKGNTEEEEKAIDDLVEANS